MKRTNILFLFLALLFVACQGPSLKERNQKKELKRKNQELKIVKISTDSLSVTDTVYVSSYSSIYSKTEDILFELTATLSIRNTSMYDSLIIEKIDYFDSDGQLLTKYLKAPISLQKLESIAYVVEESDQRGGIGANFQIIWHATNASISQPIIQTIMLSTKGQQGVAFTAQGVSISRK